MDLSTRNAVTHYRKAFLILAELQPHETQLLKMSKPVPLDDSTGALLEKCDPAIQEWIRATEISKCDWAIDLSTHCKEYTTELEKTRDLMMLVRLWSRNLFHHELVPDAADALARIFVTARHVGREGLYISKMSQWAFELWAVETIADHFPKLDSEVCGNMAARLRSLPEVMSLAQAVQREKHVTGQMPDAVFQTMSLTEYENLLKMTCSPKEVEMIRAVLGGSLSRLMKLERDLLPLYDKAAEIVSLPLDQSRDAFAGFLRDHRKSNPLVISMVRSLEKLRYAEVRALVRFTQLQAAHAIKLMDREAWRDAKDPSTGGAFGYRPFRGGFELVSPPPGVGWPSLTLAFGKKEGWLNKIRRLFTV